ncbi:sensor histidine kinase, partial [Pseudoalteromonas ruthenica]
KLTESQLRNAQLMQRMWLFVALTCLLLGILITYILFSKNRTARLKANLYQQNLKQKDQMLADISHELRTPLSVLKLHI